MLSDAACSSAGWSFGGVVAFEIARILTSRGVKVAGVVLIDSPSPSAPPLLSDAIIDCLLRDRDRERTIDSSMTALVTRQFKQSTVLLAKYVPGTRNAAREAPVAFLRCTAGFYPDGVEDVPAWFRERGQVGQIVGSWEALVGGPIPVWDVPGHHFEPFSRVHVSCFRHVDPRCVFHFSCVWC